MSKTERLVARAEWVRIARIRDAAYARQVERYEREVADYSVRLARHYAERAVFYAQCASRKAPPFGRHFEAPKYPREPSDCLLYPPEPYPR